MVSVNSVEKKQSEAAKAPSGRTGIPKAVQARFEAASGLSFEDVRVHYNSSRPAQLGAYAYTRGSQVYIGPGQERHLEHELGHVVQQKRGLVRADGYINGIPVNRDPRLEQAADAGAGQPAQGVFQSGGGTVQMMLGGQGDGGGPAPALRPAPPVPEQEPAAEAEAAPAPEEEAEMEGQYLTVPRNLYAFGNAGGPRLARRSDFGIEPDEEEVGPEEPPLPQGASTFADVESAPLTGHYHQLNAGVRLPAGLGVVADGSDVNPGSPHGPGHHTIFPAIRMLFNDFNRLFSGAGWTHAGNKRQRRRAGRQNAGQPGREAAED